MDYIFDEIDIIECDKCGSPSPLILQSFYNDDKLNHYWVCSSCGEIVKEY